MGVSKLDDRQHHEAFLAPLSLCHPPTPLRSKQYNYSSGTSSTTFSGTLSAVAFTTSIGADYDPLYQATVVLVCPYDFESGLSPTLDDRLLAPHRRIQQDLVGRADHWKIEPFIPPW